MLNFTCSFDPFVVMSALGALAISAGLFFREIFAFERANKSKIISKSSESSKCGECEQLRDDYYQLKRELIESRRNYITLLSKSVPTKKEMPMRERHEKMMHDMKEFEDYLTDRPKRSLT